MLTKEWKRSSARHLLQQIVGWGNSFSFLMLERKTTVEGDFGIGVALSQLRKSYGSGFCEECGPE